MLYNDDNRCFVCGKANSHGLQLTFVHTEDECFTDFLIDERYQGYNGITHGGIIATVLDEVMAKYLGSRSLRAVTAKMEVQYKKPVPTGESIRFTARLKQHKRNIYQMTATAILPNNDVAAEAQSTFVELGENHRSKGGSSNENYA